MALGLCQNLGSLLAAAIVCVSQLLLSASARTVMGWIDNLPWMYVGGADSAAKWVDNVGLWPKTGPVFALVDMRPTRGCDGLGYCAGMVPSHRTSQRYASRCASSSTCPQRPQHAKV
ncbi:hypothetical protein PSPO01_02648 [Paraphaeosphaeria sporulosa]